MGKEFRPNANYAPWGPFVPDHFKNEPISEADIIIAAVVLAVTLVNVGIAIWLAYRQSRSSRSPLRSIYVWLIWLELIANIIMALECFLHLCKIIRPSFAFYTSILLCWCIQVQLLLQIIINRIRIIVTDRRHSKMIMIGTAAIVTAINVSVFTIWIPARLQISQAYINLNGIWDRIEKVIYLLIDAALNWYFLKVVKANLISNGLQKYTKLLRFNQRIIILSLLMDVMIIAAMSIPNSFVYIQFHPLAYTVKLNIEMTMANLIKRIAISSSRKTGNAAMAQEFNSSNLSSSGGLSRSGGTKGTHHGRRSSLIELSSNVFTTKSFSERERRAVSFAPNGKQIKVTEDIYIKSEPNPEYERDPEFGRDDLDVRMGRGMDGLKPGQGMVVKSKSLDEITESAESVKSEYGQGKGDSDDEAALVIQGKQGSWSRLRG